MCFCRYFSAASRLGLDSSFSGVYGEIPKPLCSNPPENRGPIFLCLFVRVQMYGRTHIIFMALSCGTHHKEWPDVKQEKVCHLRDEKKALSCFWGDCVAYVTKRLVCGQRCRAMEKARLLGG